MGVLKSKDNCMWGFIFLLFITCNFVLISLMLGDRVVLWEEKGAEVFSDEMGCNCLARSSNESVWLPLSKMSTCDTSATLRGGRQMVVSFSFDGDFDPAYLPSSSFFGNVSNQAESIGLYYPNWVMRVYHNLDVKDAVVRDALCYLWCRYPHLDFCSMDNLPPPLMDQSHVNPNVGRFFVLGDPLIDRFVVRDLDSVIIEREMAAVGHWLISGKSWHFMHDHPSHTHRIMQGLWGGLNVDVEWNKNIRELLIEEAQSNADDVLSSVLLPIAEESDDYLSHDSYSCDKGLVKTSWPWPVKRQGGTDVVGNSPTLFQHPLTHSCPKLCRPINHQDWEFC